MIVGTLEDEAGSFQVKCECCAVTLCRHVGTCCRLSQEPQQKSFWAALFLPWNSWDGTNLSFSLCEVASLGALLYTLGNLNLCKIEPLYLYAENTFCPLQLSWGQKLTA